MSDVIADRLSRALQARYRVERELGRGGMAIVYLAYDEKHGRPVAIKVLRPELAESMERERFSREIGIAARLNHPNILGLHDSGEANGVTFFVMPFVEGESLRDVLEREGTLSVELATQYTGEVAEALAYAHGLGLVHRDVKPGNILFQAGHAIVCDFGIAKAVSEVRQHTRTGVSVGTFTYMSPEQLTEGREVDGRADVYALGCILHEMLEGMPPFQASTPAAAMAKKLTGKLAGQSSRRDVPATVWDVTRKALATDPDRRFATADDFAAALRHATTEIAMQRNRVRRLRRRVGTLIAGVAAVAALTAGGWWATSLLGGGRYERLAVMPLENGSGDPREEFYVRGVHEDLVEEMQRAGLRVINASSARRIGQEAGTAAEIAERLDVDALVEGSVERIGPRVVAALRLVDATSQDLVWNESFTAAQLDVIRLIRDMTASLAARTGVRLSADAEARLNEAVQVDAVLYELLLQARFEKRKLTAEALDDAERYYERAIARDSLSAEAWIGLGSVWSYRAQQGFVPGDEARARNEELIAQAQIQGIEMSDPERAQRLTWPLWPEARWAEAESAFLATLERAPSDSRTRAYYAMFLLYMGREEEAEREGERAASQAPDDQLVQGLYGQLLNGLHRYDDAEAALTRARRFDPDAPMLLSTLRATYHVRGEHDLAMEIWRDSYRSGGDLEALEALDRGYDAGGYGAALRSVAELFERRREQGQYVTPWQIGTLYTRADMFDKAIEYLGLALDEGDYNCLSLAVDPIFDHMRGDPRFEALVDRLQLPDR